MDGVALHGAGDVDLVADVGGNGVLVFDLVDLVAHDENSLVAHLHALLGALDVVLGAGNVLGGTHGVGDGALPVFGEGRGGRDAEEDGGGQEKLLGHDFALGENVLRFDGICVTGKSM